MARKSKVTKTEVKDLKRCACGCGAVVQREFAQGHDQRHKGVLLRAFDAGNSNAAEELVERGWRTANDLEERRLAREAKAEKGARAAGEREAKKVAVQEGSAEQAGRSARPQTSRRTTELAPALN